MPVHDKGAIYGPRVVQLGKSFYIIFLATIIDRYWLATSKKCCLGKGSFDVKFDDKNKSQWIFWGKKKQQKCVRKHACSKMIPRSDEEF